MNMFRTLLVAGLVAMAAPAFAQDTAVPQLTDDQAAEVMDFAMHDAVYTLYHESGHLLIHELGLPVLGKEEDAADALGVILIFKNTADKDELFNTLADASDGWYWSAEETTGNGIDDLSYYDDHSLDIQRAYAMVCMMVGAEPDEFREIADDYQLDADQQDACAGTYQQALDSWTTELAPHLAKKPGPEIKVTYQDAGDLQPFEDELKARHILEDLGKYLSTNFALPGPLTISAENCDEPNAYYTEDEHKVIYCYQLAADMYDRGAINIFGNPDQSESSDEGDSEEGTTN